jgi:hypothetical protein
VSKRALSRGPLLLSAPKALWIAHDESLIMSAGSRRPYMEDVLLDLLLATDISTVTSLQDCKMHVLARLKTWLEQDTTFLMGNLADRLAIKIMVYLETKTIPSEGKLGKLIRATRRTNLVTELLVLYTNVSNVGSLSIKIPNIDEGDDETVKTLTLLLELACVTHATAPDNLRIVKDAKLGEGKILMSSSFNKLVSKLLASAKSTSGMFDGPDVAFKDSSYKAPPPCLLASMRLLQSKDHLVRRSTTSGSTALNVFSLQQRFNESLGLKSEDQNTYSIKLLKGILASCVKPHNKGFPGGWVHHNRGLNKVKSDSGLLNVLGWVEKIPSNHKLLDVLFNPVDSTFGIVDGKSKIVSQKLRNLTQSGTNMTFQEFRTAVLLSAPRMTFDGDFESQLKKEPLEIKNPIAADYFSKSELTGIVSALNTSFAFKVNLKNPKSKTTLVHYNNARNRLLSLTANKEIVDGKGLSYKTFSEIPENVQTFFRRKYRYPVKRTITSTTEGETTGIVDAVMEEVSRPETPARSPIQDIGISNEGPAVETRASASRKAKKQKKK